VIHSTLRSLRFLTLAALIVACGGTPAPGPGVDAAGTDAAAPVGDAGGGMTEPITIRVGDVDDAPIAGAVVAIDRPSGARVEATTGADGLAHFDVDWSVAPFDVIAWAPGYAARALVRRDRALFESSVVDGVSTILLGSIVPPETITVSGAITNLADPLDTVALYDTAGAATWNGRTGPYALEVPANVPFQLIVVETRFTAGTDRDFTQTTAHTLLLPEHAGSATDLTIDVDLSMNEATPTTVAGSFPIPASTTADPFFGGATAYVTVYNDRPTAFSIGTPTASTFAADGRSVDYELEYVLPTAGTSPVTLYLVVDGDRRSQATRPGLPVAGAQSFTLLPVPDVRELVPGEFPHVFDTVVVRNPVPDARPSVVFSSGDVERYRVSGPPGEDHVVIPPLPTGGDAAGVLAGEIARQVQYCALTGADAATQYCERFSTAYRTPADP
jgi:hypothetical protein